MKIKILLYVLALISAATSPALALAQEWSQPMRISDNYACFRPKIIYSGEFLHLIYSSGVNRAFYQRSTNDGLTWSSPFRMDQGTDGTSAKPTMAVRGSTVVAAWYHSLDVGHNIGFRRSTNGGANWNAVSFVLPSNYLNLQKLALTISDLDIFLLFTYADSSIRFCLKKSTDMGVSWTPSDELFQVQSSEGMDLLNRGDTLLLLWSAVYSWQDLMELYFCRSTDGGDSWSEIQLLSTFDSSGSQNPCLALNERGELAAVWTDFKYSSHMFTGDVFVRYSSDLGETWTAEQSLTDDHLAAFPRAVWQGDSLHLSWEDYFQDPGNISYMRSTDNGLTWQPREAVDDTSADSFYPGVALTPGKVHLLWDERRDTEQGVFYSYRTEEPDGVGGDESGPLPVNIDLTSYPNPFNSSVVIAYSASKGGEIKIINSLGQIIRKFDVEASIDGKVVWDGANEAGHQAASGTYFAKLSSGEQTREMKLIYLK
jgi:hypothetical protein